MIDLATETLVSLTEAAKLLPTRRKGRPVHVATLYRWHLQGVKGIRLEVLQVGGSRCTSVQALQRFFDQLSQKTNSVRVKTSKQRQREVDRAKQELDREGI